MRNIFALVCCVAILGCHRPETNSRPERGPGQTLRAIGSFSCPRGTKNLPLTHPGPSVDSQMCFYGADRRLEIFIGNHPGGDIHQFAFFGEGKLKQVAWLYSGTVEKPTLTAFAATGYDAPYVYMYTYHGNRDDLLREISEISQIAP